MISAWNPIDITIVNIVLCIIILILGYWGYKRGKGIVPLFVGIAFALFGVSHVVALLGLTAKLVFFLVIIRIIAYLLVMFALYRLLVAKKEL